MPSIIGELPEPFQTALGRNEAHQVCDAEALTPQALFARALARRILGRNAQSRADLEQAVAALPEACRLELAFLDQVENQHLDQALETAREIGSHATPDSPLLARSRHVAGLCELKLGRHDTAIDALLQAAAAYGSSQDWVGRAQVFDSLGMVESDAGRLDDAIHFYALSLVDKTLCDDRLGIAMTLGNLGRLHLSAGRPADALACFERDLKLSTELQDRRGVARMHEDLGRARLQMDDLTEAQTHLEQALALAREYGYRDIELYAHKDLALVAIRSNRWADAAAALAAGQQLLEHLSAHYFQLLLTSARGELLAAQTDPACLPLLEEAAVGFTAEGPPEAEVAARIAWAKALVSHQQEAAARNCLLRALNVAHRKGLKRFLAVLQEALAGLGLTEEAETEQGRHLTDVSPSRPTDTVSTAIPTQPAGTAGAASATQPAATNDDYVPLERLGGGTYGEVFRAYDPRRGREVALKRLRLERLYDSATRERIVSSARRELAVASLVRHPGVVRVLAVGTSTDDGTYIVQDFVPGHSLRHYFPVERRPPIDQMLRCLSQIAYALEALHATGVIHRDLKPDNVILRADGSPVLIDFGIAQLNNDMLRIESFAGTLEYAAPEQLASKSLDGRADLYALGVIVFEWFCGLRPLAARGATLAEIARDIGRRQPPTVIDFCPEVDPALSALVATLLAKKPRHRPRDARAVAEEFGGIAARLAPKQPAQAS